MNEIPQLHLPVASPAALFVGTLGRIFIWSGAALFVVALLQNIFVPKAKRLGSVSFILGCTSIFGAFVTLGSILVRNQYEFKYAFEHSQASDGLQYKIASIWSGQEGSFLLWATTSAIFALFTIRGTGPYQRWFTAIYSVFLASLCGILAYESPFVVQYIHGTAYIPPDGTGLNASLQNYWVVIHPPTIFLGFGSLTVLFAYAFSALMNRDYKDWVPRVRPWALVSLSLVGIGLCMGGFWAYETLGWGGFWKWDPVENVSFVPWCLVAALVHGLIVQTTRSKWFFTNLLLAGLPFLLFVYGTFLTRAGFLDGLSVHSFAQMEHTAHMVLLTLCVTAFVSFMGLWIFRTLKDHIPDEKPSTSREAWYRVGGIFLVLTAFATAIGMSVPLFQYVMNRPPKVVDEHVYHLVLTWFFIPIIFMMAIGPFVSWRKMPLKELATRVFNIFSVTIGLLGLMMLVMNNPTFGIHALPGETIDFPFGWKAPLMPWVTGLIGLCLFSAVANLWRIVELWKRSKPSLGAFIAHIGVATAMAGLIISRSMERAQLYEMQENDISTAMYNINENGAAMGGPVLPFSLELHAPDEDKLHTDKTNRLDITVRSESGTYEALPVLYLGQQEDDTERISRPDISSQISHDMYLSMGPRQIPASDPETLATGETKTFLVPDFQSGRDINYKLTYLTMVREGQPGQAGTRFIAKVMVEAPNGTKLLVKPAIEIGGGGGPQIKPVIVDSDFFLTMMRMDAGSKSVTLQLNFVRPAYMAFLYYKPMVKLVWFGAGIMMFGGLLSAWNRRGIVKSGPDLGISKLEPSPEPEPEAVGVG